MKDRGEITRREILQTTGFLTAGAGLWLEKLFQKVAQADEKPSADGAPIGRRQIIMGLDGMSRVADEGNRPFEHGHSAAAVIASAFFSRNEKLDEATQKEMLSFIEARHLHSPIYMARPKERAEPELVPALVDVLDSGIEALRFSGHNIIFAVISLKALREVPEAATPERMQGLQRMVRSFGTNKGTGFRPNDKETYVDLSDEKRFIRFVFEEYLKALELYINGKGHHGFAAHILTVGHALLELRRMGYVETADKGVQAYWQFVEQARRGANLGGKRVEETPPQFPTSLMRDYWIAQNKRQANLIINSHLIKYPYSFYDLARDLRDETVKQRIYEKLYYLTAMS